MLNLGHFLNVTAGAHPEVTAVILDDYKMTYAEVASAARRVANVLKAKGLGPGDKIAMMLPNTPHFPIVYYGILLSGATVVPVNALYTEHEIVHYLSDSGAVAFFAFELFEAEARKAFEGVRECKHFIVAGPPGNDTEPELGENFMNLVLGASDEFDTVQTMPDDTAAILYTSGTTGAPKGAELTHFNLFFNAYFCSSSLTEVQPGDVSLVTLPLFHSFGQTCLMNSCILGAGAMTLVPRFETQKVMEVIARDKVKTIALVPTMYFFILNEPNWKDYDFSNLERAMSGGAALPEDVHRRFQERYGVTILEGYGLSETSPVATFSVAGEKLRVGSIGRPIWGVEIKIMRDDGRFAETGEVGEIVIRGHNVMKGYYNQPEATAKAIVNGWFHSGDLGRVTKDGFFYVVDRKKDLIIRGGMNIYPREIEEVLYTHPKVLEASVIGIADVARGEELKVFVSAKAGEKLLPEEITAYLQARTAKYKWPKEVEVLEALPVGPTGKILKRELKQR